MGLDAESDTGKEYLHDVFWARQFAAASRKAMAEETGKVLTRTLKCSISWQTMIAIDHNHVALEHHGERELWVHRKGAMSAQQGRARSPAGVDGQPQLPCGGTRLRRGALFERSRCRPSSEPGRSAEQVQLTAIFGVKWKAFGMTTG